MVRNILIVLCLVSSFFFTTISRAAENCDKAALLTEESRQLIDSNPASAEQKLREAVAYCSKSPSLHYNLGVALFQREKNREATSEFEEALRLKPSYAKAMNSLAVVLYANREDRDYGRALQLAKKALELDPRNREIRSTYDMISATVDLPPATSANNDDAIAVVIGNKNYSAAGIPLVEYADRDALVMKKYLIETLGFREQNVLLYLDAKFTDLLSVFGDSDDHKGLLYNRTRSEKSAVFCFLFRARRP